MDQWTNIQAELATTPSSQIGSICAISEAGDPVIGRFNTGGLTDAGPFATGLECFTDVANAGIDRLSHDAKAGALVVRDILAKTDLFRSVDTSERYHLNHMDLGAQNVLADENFPFVAIADWEFAQFAPWQINRYPMPFPLLGLDIENILQGPTHLAYKNVLPQNVSQALYTRKFIEKEKELEAQGRTLHRLFLRILNSPASRVTHALRILVECLLQMRTWCSRWCGLLLLFKERMQKTTYRKYAGAWNEPIREQLQVGLVSSP